jgi:hypothetical protein
MRHPDLWCLSGSQLQENRSVEVDFEVAAHGHILHGPRSILLGLDGDHQGIQISTKGNKTSIS